LPDLVKARSVCS